MLALEAVGRMSGLLELRSSTRFSETKGYELIPNRKNINSHGLRDREISIEKPINTFRILALGDSYTYGHRVTSEGTYVKQLEAMLNQKLGHRGIRYEVLNAGVPGYNTRQELIHLQEVGLLYQPDAIILGFTMTDAELGFFDLKDMDGQLWMIRFKEWIKNHFVLYDFVRKHLKRLVNRIESARHNVKVRGAAFRPLQEAAAGRTNAGWERCRESLEKFAAIASNRRIPILLIIYPSLRQLDDTYPLRASHALIAETATKYGMGVVDLLPHFKGREPAVLWVSPKDRHPNAFAHAIAAKAIYESLLEHRFLPTSP
jgi:lysophospholipase L1-like esterase